MWCSEAVGSNDSHVSALKQGQHLPQLAPLPTALWGSPASGREPAAALLAFPSTETCALDAEVSPGCAHMPVSV